MNPRAFPQTRESSKIPCMNCRSAFALAAALFIIVFASSCAKEVEAPVANASPTPGTGFTPDDIAKLKWLEGTWRGMDGDKPFFERYRIEGTTLVVEGLEDETLSKIKDTSRFELRNGEFGVFEDDGGSRASSISADSVQFVPAKPGKGNLFRFERQPEGWRAVLEWPATADKPARQKIYNMEPVK